MADDDLYFDVPGATGDAGGGADAGQGASGEGAPADRNSALQQQLDRMGAAIETLRSDKEKTQKSAEVDQLKRRIGGAIQKKMDEVSAAETALAEAYDNGEGVEIAKAQRKLGELTAAVERMKAEGGAMIRQMEEDSKRGDDNLDTSNLDQWKSRNDWYGTNSQMTQAAHEIGREIEGLGQIKTGTREYFDAIDRRMRQKFPDILKGSPGAASQTQDQGGGDGRRVRVSRSIADGWRRMGIDVDDPKVVERMLKHRQTAVNKGILPEEPVVGRIRT